MYMFFFDLIMGQSGIECGKIIHWQTGRMESSRLKCIKYFTRSKQIFTWPFINFLTVSYDLIFDRSEARSS